MNRFNTGDVVTSPHNPLLKRRILEVNKDHYTFEFVGIKLEEGEVYNTLNNNNPLLKGWIIAE